MQDGLYVMSASWCQNCSVLKSMLDRNNIPYKVIDADNEEGVEFGVKYKVRSLPVSFIFKDGEVVKMIPGVKPVEEYKVQEECV